MPKRSTSTSAKRRRRPSKRKRRKGRKRRFGRSIFLAALVCGGALAWLLWPFWQLSGQFAAHPTEQPSRLYGAAPELRPGGEWTRQSFLAWLEEAGYSAATGAELLPGSYRANAERIEVYRRRFLTKSGAAGGNRLRARFSGSRIASLEVEDRRVASAFLDPPLVASYYGSELRERRPFVSIDAELPEDLILAVLAIEDANFLSHPGISLTGTLRAAWSNLRDQRLGQGGSTLTQQLVKNIYLSHERTWMRKIREAILAVLLELRYDKRAIFRAYLNEIYWGRSGSINLMGVGAAAWAYFGKEPAQLTLAESALLAGMIRSPSRYSPITSPERAKERRNMVLERLAQLNWVEIERLEAASSEPIVVRQGRLVARRAPFFADAMAEEARRRFRLGELRDAGYVLVSTLRLDDQLAAEEAVGWGVDALEKGWEKGRGKDLQAALVSVNPSDGAVLAYVGGEDYGASQFDRVANARRQPGSSFKPIVFAAALAERAATSASIFDDEPLTVTYDNRSWSPRNSDGKYRGPVSARTALEKSLNVPTARLALVTGLDPIIELAHAMGIEGRIRAFPALALGSMEVTPREMATVYATFAAGGVRPALHGLEAVFDRTGKPIGGAPLKKSRRVLAEDVAYLVTDLLRGVLDNGTGRGARDQGLTDPLAGKTGTTNDRRDSWFAGYSPDRATLVWVGYDDNSKTRLSGARAALPIWTRFTHKVRPRGGFTPFVEPEGIVRAWIDPETGGLATTRCPRVRAELFLRSFPPGELCGEHLGRALPQPEAIAVPEEDHPFRRWLHRMKKGRRSD